MSTNVIRLTDVIARREKAQEQYFEALARRCGFASFQDLADIYARSIDVEFEGMAQALGFDSFDAFVQHEQQRGVS
jgi:hypothetical protein